MVAVESFQGSDRRTDESGEFSMRGMAAILLTHDQSTGGIDGSIIFVPCNKKVLTKLDC
jgi:hypothetical protein